MNANASRNQSGYTLVEMIVSATVAVLLIVLITAAASRYRRDALQTGCLSNLRELQAAWIKFAEEHNGLLPDAVGAEIDGQWKTLRGWAIGNAKLSGGLDSLTQGQLYPYTQRPDPYRCPADTSSLQHSNRPRLRSYALNVYCLPSYPAHISFAPDLADISAPERSLTFIDEEAVSINDGAFAVHPQPKALWWDIPADRHNQGAALAFVDGHAEYWKWRAPKPGFPPGGTPRSPEDAADLFQLQSAAVLR